MALIRQGNATRISQGAIVLDLGDIMRQGESLKAQCRKEAAEIVEAAKRERDRLIKGAAEEGHREGYGRGLEEGRVEGEAAGREAAVVEYRERLAKLDAAWTEALASWEGQRDAMLLEARVDVLRLAVAMGELVTRRAITVQPESVADQVEAVLKVHTQPTRLSIRVHPQDRSIVERALPGAQARVSSAHHIELADDATLERGSVIAATSGGGEIDASIRTQLDRIVQTLIPGSGAGAAS